MGNYPVEIKRCQHIKTSGAQCGSPALKGEKLCYYHEQNRTVPANIYLEGERDADDQIMIPPLEDAHAVQMVVRHVIQLMMERRIDRKDAGLMLYALQIASGNLKQMQAEKPRPTQVVMDPEKVEETPLGMTPWSAKGEGHDVEDGEGGEDEGPPPPTPERLLSTMDCKEARLMRREFVRRGLITELEYEKYLVGSEPDQDPLLPCFRRLCGAGGDNDEPAVLEWQRIQGDMAEAGDRG